MDEKELFRLIHHVQKNGDAVAADTLVRGFYDEIFVYAARQVKDRHTAMDITQQIFISMLQTIGRYDGEKAGFRTWLYRIATNKIIDFHRSNGALRKKVLALDDVDLAVGDDFAERLGDADLAGRIMAQVSGYDPEVQRIFRLKVYGGHTFVEIAGMLEMAEATVKTKYYRLVKALRKEFADAYEC